MAKKAAPKKSVHITSVEAKDFHRLSVCRVEFVPGKGLVTITGKNASGKTSLLRAIMAALGGGGAIRKDTVRKGADRAQVKVELDNGYTIIRKFSEQNPKGSLTVIDKLGGKHNQGKLNEWLGARSFDPLSFFTLKPAAQRDVLLSIATDPDLAKNLAALKEERQGAYDRRTPYISRKQVATRVERPDGDKPEPIDVSAKMDRLGELRGMQEARDKAGRDARDLQGEVRRAADEWQRLKDTVEVLTEQLQQAQANAEDAKVKHAEATAKLERSVELYEELPDYTAAMDDIQEEIAAAGNEAQALRPWTRWEEAQAELEEVQCTIDSLTEEIQKNDAAQTRLLANSGIPVKGLSFTVEGEPLLNDNALEVASGRERIDMAVNVAMAADPDLKICLLDEANDLDEDALKLLNDRAIENDFQIWIARISKEGGGEIIVEDGVAESAEPADAQETMQDVVNS